MNFIRLPIKFPKLFLLLLIALIAFVIFNKFILLNKFYIYTDLGQDTLNSYWPYFVMMADKLNSGNFSSWSSNMGLGTSIFSVFMYIFDPFHLLLFLSGKNNIIYLLPYVAILKIMLAGFFCYLYLATFNFNRYAILVGSLLYAFNGHLILWGQHYMFATFIVFIPLTLYAFEKWLVDGKWMLLIFSIAIMAGNNFYFFYMFSIYFFVYVLFRCFSSQLPAKRGIQFLLKTVGFYLLGLLISAVLLFPVLNVLLSSPRVKPSLNLHSLFQLNDPAYYISGLFRFLSNDIQRFGNDYYGFANYYESPIFYCGLVVLLLVPQVFQALENKRLKFLYSLFLLILFILIVFQFSAVMMNAFTGYQFRWTFVIIIAELYLATFSLNHIIDKKTIDIKVLFYSLFFIILVSLLAAIIGFIGLGWSKEVFMSILGKLFKVFALLSVYSLLLILVANMKEKKLLIIKILLLALISLELIVFSSISVEKRSLLEGDYVSKRAGYYDYTNEALNLIKTREENNGYRIDKSYLSVLYNDPVFQNYRGVTAYNSVNSQSYLEFLKALNVPFIIPGNSAFIDGFDPLLPQQERNDSRFRLQTLVGVKYYLTKNKNAVPPNYQFMGQTGDVYIYLNKSFLPLGFAYNYYIPQELFERLTPLEKDRVLLKAFVSEKAPKDLEQLPETKLQAKNNFNTKLDSHSITIANMTVRYNEFPNSLDLISLNDDPQILLKLETTLESPLKISLEVTSDVEGTGQLFWSDNTNFSEKDSQTFHVSKGSKLYQLDVGSGAINNLRLDILDKSGNVTIRNLKIEELNLAEYENDVNQLNKNSLEVDEYLDGFVNGKIKMDKVGMMFLSIPYDKGWSIKVDGKKRDLENIDYGFMGVELDAGVHVIELRYRQPFLALGGITTACSLATLVFIILFQKRKKIENND